MEIWKSFSGYEGLYELSNKGSIRSLSKKTGRGNGYLTKSLIIKQNISNSGYLRVVLWKNNFCKNFSVHRLVAETFIPNPENKPQVNHKNGIKTDNRVENLEWSTITENMRHASKNGLLIGVKGEKNHNSKLTKEQVVEIKKIGNSKSQSEIADLYGVNRRQIGRILNNKRWKHIKI